MSGTVSEVGGGGRRSSLQGRVVLITGGARRQGASHAGRLAEGGATVVTADVLDEEGKATAQRLAGDGLAVSYRHLDVTRSDEWKSIVAGIETDHGGLHVLVNNAGIFPSTPLMDCS